MMQTQRKEGFVKRLMKKSSNMRHFHHHRASKNTVTFHFKLFKPAEDYAGEVILISGSIPELGNGSIAEAARMYLEETSEGKLWKYDLVVPVKELEHARMDISGSYEGNPHGNFFTYNYVVKKPDEKGVPAIEKFESVPRRGVPKSSLMTTNSLGEQVFLSDFTIDHTWSSSTSTPSSIIVSKKDLSSNDSLGGKAEITPVMKGKASTSDSSPMSPARPRAATLNTDTIPRLQEVLTTTPVKPTVERSASVSSFSMISKTDQETLDRLKAQLDEKDKKKGMFSWYKNMKSKDRATEPSEDSLDRRAQSMYSPETERQQRYMREASAQVVTQPPQTDLKDDEPITIVIEDPLPSIPQEEKATSNTVKSQSPDERRAEEQKIIENQINLRRSYDSYQQRSRSEEAMETITTRTEMVRIEDDESVAFVAPQLVTSDHERLEQDPLMNAVDPELKEQKFNFNASIEELEQKVISNLKDAEIARSFSDAQNYATSDEVSEDVLLDRIEENTPLLAPAESQLQDIEDSETSGLTRSGIINFVDYVEEPSEASEPRSLPVGSVDPVMFGKIHRLNKEILEATNRRSPQPTDQSSTSSFGINAVLSGKMYRVGQELKQMVFGESGWSNFLQSHKDLQSSLQSFDSVDPVVSGKLHKVHRELISKVAGKSVEVRNEWLSTRSASSMPASEPVDPIISGKMHRVHSQLKQKLPESGRLVDFFGFVHRAFSFSGMNPIMSGKMHKVHQELISMIPLISAIKVTPSLWNTGVPEITIKDESLKTMSVFEEQMEKELHHRKVHKLEETISSPLTNAGKVSTKDLKTVGFHTVRNDFMPISHSESMMASETSTSPLTVQLYNQSPKGVMIMFAIFLWFLLFSIYFPESMLAETGQSSSTEVVRAKRF